jgi:hypothetical protein
MTDRELWVKTCKTVGAMTGGTVLLLGSMSLLLMLVVGRSTASASEAPGAATASDLGKSDLGKSDTAAVPPSPARSFKHGAATNGRSGESI